MVSKVMVADPVFAREVRPVPVTLQEEAAAELQITVARSSKLISVGVTTIVTMGVALWAEAAKGKTAKLTRSAKNRRKGVANL